jgi:hypothetical protein
MWISGVLGPRISYVVVAQSNHLAEELPRG